MKSIRNKSLFGREQEMNHQTVHERIKAGWKFGILDGDEVMYNPKSIRKLKVSLSESKAFK